VEVSVSALHHQSEFVPLVGTPGQIRTQLDKSKASQVVALPVVGMDADHAALLARTLGDIASFISHRLIEQDEQAFKSLVNALLPKAPLSPSLIKEAEMQARARRAVLEGTEWLTAAHVAQLAELSPSNPSAQPNKWKRSKQIFAIHHNGVDYYPHFALDPATGYRPRKSLKPILDVFADTKDGWGLAFWFLALNGFLGGRRPLDLLATKPELVLAAAVDEVGEVSHA